MIRELELVEGGKKKEGIAGLSKTNSLGEQCLGPRANLGQSSEGGRRSDDFVV